MSDAGPPCTQVRPLPAVSPTGGEGTGRCVQLLGQVLTQRGVPLLLWTAIRWGVVRSSALHTLWVRAAQEGWQSPKMDEPFGERLAVSP